MDLTLPTYLPGLAGPALMLRGLIEFHVKAPLDLVDSADKLERILCSLAEGSYVLAALKDTLVPSREKLLRRIGMMDRPFMQPKPTGTLTRIS